MLVLPLSECNDLCTRNKAYFVVPSSNANGSYSFAVVLMLFPRHSNTGHFASAHAFLTAPFGMSAATHTHTHKKNLGLNDNKSISSRKKNILKQPLVLSQPCLLNGHRISFSVRVFTETSLSYTSGTFVSPLKVLHLEPTT